MKVSRESWHYNLVDTVWSETWIEGAGNNLCKYFWMLVWSIVVVAFIFTVMGVALAIVCKSVVGAGLYWGVANMFILLFILSIMILPAMAVSWLRAAVGKNTEIKTPTILSEYVKAKKNKYCPMIDFED